jgi:hypothetical protein
MRISGFVRYALCSCVAAALLAAGCGGSQPPIAAPGDSPRLPLPSLDDNGTSPLALKICATRPPQHEWILKGACQASDLQECNRPRDRGSRGVRTMLRGATTRMRALS